MCSTHVPRAAFAESAADSFCDASVSTSSHLVDLTATIGPELVVFESAEGLGPDHRYQSSSQSDGDPANVSELRFGAHTGTHVDAPRHFARTNDAGVETLRLSWLNGPAIVVDIFGADVPEDVVREIDDAGNEVADLPDDWPKLKPRVIR